MELIKKIIKALFLSENNIDMKCLNNNDMFIIENIKKWIDDNNVHDVEIIIFKSLWNDILSTHTLDCVFNEKEFKSLYKIVSNKEFNKISKKYKTKVKPIVEENKINRGIDVLSMCPDALAYGPFELSTLDDDEIELYDEYPYWWILKIK